MPYTIEPPSGDSPSKSKYAVEPPPAPASPEKVYYNDAGQPFTLSGKPPPVSSPASPSDGGYTGSFLPLRRDEAGLHPALPEVIASPLRGAITGGQRALGVGEVGQNPLRRLTDDELNAAMAMSPLTPGISRAPTPGLRPPLPASGISPERALLAREARDAFGIPVTAPQIGMSPTGKMADAAIRGIPLSGARESEMATRQAFNRAVSKTFGEDATAITQTVMDQAKKRIGGEINRIENANQVAMDGQLLADLAAIERTARAGLTDEEYSVVKRQLDNVMTNVLPGGTIQGTTYGNLLSRKSPLDQAVGNQNSNISRPAAQIKSALQDALERSLSGSDLEDYRAARFQYKNMKTIEPLVNKAATGDISPALLNNRVSTQFPNRAYDTSGTNPLDRLAKIGQAFLKEPPSSGSSERGGAMYGVAKAGELLAALAAGHFIGIPETLGGVAGGLAASRGVGSYLRSPRVAERTIERGINPVPRGGVPSGAEMAYRSFPGGVLGENQGDPWSEVYRPWHP